MAAERSALHCPSCGADLLILFKSDLIFEDWKTAVVSAPTGFGIEERAGHAASWLSNRLQAANQGSTSSAPEIGFRCLEQMTDAKVLIVANDDILVMNLQHLLSHHGMEVAGVTAKVSDALRLAENTRPDVVIFDVRLAEGPGGVEAVAQLRKQKEISVVFVDAQTR